MRYVVGYTPTERGADAVALATSLALAQGAHLDLVYVVKKGAPYVALNPEGSRVSAAEQEVLTAEREGLGLIPQGPPRQIPRPGGRFLCRRAHRCGGGVQGRADRRGRRQRRPFQALTGGQCGQRTAARLARAGGPGAPRGYQRTAPVTRLTLAVGQRAGAEAAIETAIDAAKRRGVPLRLVSLVELDAARATPGRRSTPRTSTPTPS